LFPERPPFRLKEKRQLPPPKDTACQREPDPRTRWEAPSNGSKCTKPGCSVRRRAERKVARCKRRQKTLGDDPVRQKKAKGRSRGRSGLTKSQTGKSAPRSGESECTFGSQELGGIWPQGSAEWGVQEREVKSERF